MTDIVMENITKRFGDFTAVDDVNITFADGEVTCLLGPSGCGKTTLMRMLAGLERPTQGRVLFGGKDVTKLPPRKRRVGMVFQYPVMYPTLSVMENLELPMRHDRGVTDKERRQRVEEVLDVLDIRPLADHFIDGLDAGTRQKVAVGRAVASRSEIVLFDEPTTNVEVNAKLQLIRAFKKVTKRLRQTIVYVTHDQTEAMTLSDRIALMKAGQIVQYDRPGSLYARPSTEFAGWFLGNPGMNFIPAHIRNGTLHAPVLAKPLRVEGDAPDGEVRIGIRPELVEMRARPGKDSVPGTLTDQMIGIAGRYLTKVKVGDEVVKVNTTGRPSANLGDAVHLALPAESLAVFAGGNRLPASFSVTS